MARACQGANGGQAQRAGLPDQAVRHGGAIAQPSTDSWRGLTRDRCRGLLRGWFHTPPPPPQAGSQPSLRRRRRRSWTVRCTAVRLRLLAACRLPARDPVLRPARTPDRGSAADTLCDATLAMQHWLRSAARVVAHRVHSHHSQMVPPTGTEVSTALAISYSAHRPLGTRRAPLRTGVRTARPGRSPSLGPRLSHTRTTRASPLRARQAPHNIMSPGSFQFSFQPQRKLRSL